MEDRLSLHLLHELHVFHYTIHYTSSSTADVPHRGSIPAMKLDLINQILTPSLAKFTTHDEHDSTHTPGLTISGGGLLLYLSSTSGCSS